MKALHADAQTVRHPGRIIPRRLARAAALLLPCREARFLFPLLCGFDFGGLLLDQLDEVVDDVGVFEAMVGGR